MRRILPARRQAALAVAGALTAIALSAPVASAGVDGCTASAVRVEDGGFGVPSFEPIRANPAGRPCVDDAHSALRTNGRVGQVNLTSTQVEAKTDYAPMREPADVGYEWPEFVTPIALANSDVDSVTITVGVTRITARGLRAAVICESTPAGNSLTFSSSVLDVTVNGQTRHVGAGPQAIETPVGILYLNTQSAPSGPFSGPLTSRALWLRMFFGGDVVVGEAILYSGVPGRSC